MARKRTSTRDKIRVPRTGRAVGGRPRSRARGPGQVRGRPRADRRWRTTGPCLEIDRWSSGPSAYLAGSEAEGHNRGNVIFRTVSPCDWIIRRSGISVPPGSPRERPFMICDYPCRPYNPDSRIGETAWATENELISPVVEGEAGLMRAPACRRATIYASPSLRRAARPQGVRLHDLECRSRSFGRGSRAAVLAAVAGDVRNI
jgi:hypothetical protein